MMVIGEVVQTERGSYVRCAPDSGVVASDRDLLTLLECSYELEANRILLTAVQLHPDFFDLSTGLAGSLFVKLTNYRVQTAIVADLFAIKSQRFQELIRESNRRGQIRYFNTVAEAEAWLLG
ncbi:MAG: DUF4180 domain-containing protein [Anaerolinea sp.]|nr:DUF4180 domain-containing protein [Anaerolinea sp.]